MRISDWSSDVCSSDLSPLVLVPSATPCTEPPPELVPSAPSPLLLLLLLPFLLSKLSPTSTTGPMCPPSRRSLDRKGGVEGKSGSVRVESGGRRIIKTNKTKDMI